MELDLTDINFWYGTGLGIVVGVFTKFLGNLLWDPIKRKRDKADAKEIQDIADAKERNKVIDKNRLARMPSISAVKKTKRGQREQDFEIKIMNHRAKDVRIALQTEHNLQGSREYHEVNSGDVLKYKIVASDDKPLLDGWSILVEYWDFPRAFKYRVNVFQKNGKVSFTDPELILI